MSVMFRSHAARSSSSNGTNSDTALSSSSPFGSPPPPPLQQHHSPSHTQQSSSSSSHHTTILPMTLPSSSSSSHGGGGNSGSSGGSGGGAGRRSKSMPKSMSMLVVMLTVAAAAVWLLFALWCVQQYRSGRHEAAVRRMAHRERTLVEHLLHTMDSMQHQQGHDGSGDGGDDGDGDKYNNNHNGDIGDSSDMGDDDDAVALGRRREWETAAAAALLRGGDGGDVSAAAGGAGAAGAGAREEAAAATSGDTAVIVFTHRRPQYLRRCIDTLLQYIPQQHQHQGHQHQGQQHRGLGRVTLFLSQDGDDRATADLIQTYVSRSTAHDGGDSDNNGGHSDDNDVGGLNIAVHRLQRDRSDLALPEKPVGGSSGIERAYHHISQHYRFGLQKVFDHPRRFARVIVLEEDIEVAPDFFRLFGALAPVLDRDESLLCVSGFNDNGMAGHVQDGTALYRSDFFPGLGWMMTRRLWEELSPKWPLGYWDDWLRLPENRRGRACIRPEVSRSNTFGEKGVSRGQFYRRFLEKIVLHRTPVDWASVDLSHHTSRQRYDAWLDRRIAEARPITLQQRDHQHHQQQQQQDGPVDLKITYRSAAELKSMIRVFQLMDDAKSGVPRGAYRGVVTFRYRANRIFLVPAHETLLYDNSNHSHNDERGI